MLPEACSLLVQVPTSSELLYGTDQVTGKKKSMYPVVKVSNVYIFPGVPDIMRRAFDIVEVWGFKCIDMQ